MFNTNHLTHFEHVGYLLLTKGLKITSALHFGAIAIVTASNGYRLHIASTINEIEGIKQLINLERVKSIIENSAVVYIGLY